jgi:hypothetical protein
MSPNVFKEHLVFVTELFKMYISYMKKKLHKVNPQTQIWTLHKWSILAPEINIHMKLKIIY